MNYLVDLSVWVFDGLLRTCPDNLHNSDWIRPVVVDDLFLRKFYVFPGAESEETYRGSGSQGSGGVWSAGSSAISVLLGGEAVVH